MNRFLDGKATTEDQKDFHAQHSTVKSVFLRELAKNTDKINENVYKSLVELLHLHTSLNDELSHLWFPIALKTKNRDAIPFARKYLSGVGRMRYLRPVYRALISLDAEVARKTFEENRYNDNNLRQSYHPVAVRLVESDFEKAEKK